MGAVNNLGGYIMIRNILITRSTLTASTVNADPLSFVVGRSKGDLVDGIKLVGAQPFGVFDQKLKELQKTAGK